MLRSRRRTIEKIKGISGNGSRERSVIGWKMNKEVPDSGIGNNEVLEKAFRWLLQLVRGTWGLGNLGNMLVGEQVQVFKECPFGPKQLAPKSETWCLWTQSSCTILTILEVLTTNYWSWIIWSCATKLQAATEFYHYKKYLEKVVFGKLLSQLHARHSKVRIPGCFV